MAWQIIFTILTGSSMSKILYCAFLPAELSKPGFYWLYGSQRKTVFLKNLFCSMSLMHLVGFSPEWPGNIAIIITLTQGAYRSFTRSLYFSDVTCKTLAILKAVEQFTYNCLTFLSRLNHKNHGTVICTWHKTLHTFTFINNQGKTLLCAVHYIPECHHIEI